VLHERSFTKGAELPPQSIVIDAGFVVGCGAVLPNTQSTNIGTPPVPVGGEAAGVLVVGGVAVEGTLVEVAGCVVGGILDVLGEAL
jgi:hypothetical protein